MAAWVACLVSNLHHLAPLLPVLMIDLMVRVMSPCVPPVNESVVTTYHQITINLIFNSVDEHRPRTLIQRQAGS